MGQKAATFAALLSILPFCLRTYKVTCGDESLAESKVEDVVHSWNSDTNATSCLSVLFKANPPNF